MANAKARVTYLLLGRAREDLRGPQPANTLQVVGMKDVTAVGDAAPLCVACGDPGHEDEHDRERFFQLACSQKGSYYLNIQLFSVLTRYIHFSGLDLAENSWQETQS